MTDPARRAATTIVSLAFLAVSCGDASTEPSAAGATEIVTEVREFRDDSRVTPPNGDFKGLPHRTLRTHLWYAESPPPDSPACRNGVCAVVLLGHGFGGNATGFDAVGGMLARAGYVVASVRFPLTHGDAPGGYFTGIADVVDQPADLSFVLDGLLAASAMRRGEPLAGRIDSERVGVLGHSLGGVTALAQSRFDCCTDDRLGAVALVGVSLPAGQALFASSPAPAGPPTLLLSGSEDSLAPPEEAPIFYHAMTAPRTMVILEGADHVDLILSVDGVMAPALETSGRLLVSFFDRYIGTGALLVATLGSLEAEGHLVQHEDGGAPS